MPRFECDCGFTKDVPAQYGGKRVKCPKCGVPVMIPEELKLELDDLPSAPQRAPSVQPPVGAASRGFVVPSPAAASPRAPVPAMAAPEPEPSRLPPGPKRPAWLRWMFAIALLPLAASITWKDDIEERFRQTFEHHPEAARDISAKTSLDDVLAKLPGDRIEGAYTARDSSVQWIFAILAAAAFWGFLHLAYPRGNSSHQGMWIVGVFTGTIGILLLFAVQWCAVLTAGVWIRGGGVIALFMLIIKFIGFSYTCALDPSNGFLLSFFGFTFGVGLCEELCKALPVLWSFRSARQLPGRLAKEALLDANGAVLWGLAAGIGFGVSEGIKYSADSYNGILPGGIYVVRFVSCVALHAAWSGASAALIWKRQWEVDEADSLAGWILPILKLLAISMVAHGLYDTLLKKNMEFPALLVAVASFGWFFWLHDRVMKEEEKESEPAPPAPAPVAA